VAPSFALYSFTDRRKSSRFFLILKKVSFFFPPLVEALGTSRLLYENKNQAPFRPSPLGRFLRVKKHLFPHWFSTLSFERCDFVYHLEPVPYWRKLFFSLVLSFPLIVISVSGLRDCDKLLLLFNPVPILFLFQTPFSVIEEGISFFKYL